MTQPFTREELLAWIEDLIDCTENPDHTRGILAKITADGTAVDIEAWAAGKPSSFFRMRVARVSPKRGIASGLSI